MSNNNGEWISVSDLMAGLMMIFLFIAVLLMVKLEKEKDELAQEKDTIEEIALTYKNYKEKLNIALQKEFKDDIEQWNAEILSDNTIRFRGPEVLFSIGSSEMTPRFQTILNDFFPRYISLLTNFQFRDRIEEVRIEGHTSSAWEGAESFEERYLRNADLSQRRSFEVLAYCFKLKEVQTHERWLAKSLRANGLSFANLIFTNNVESRERSRRVEFRIKTRTEERIERIIETVGDV